MKTGNKIKSIMQTTIVPTGIEFGGVYLDTERLAPKTILNIPSGMTGKSLQTWKRKHQEIMEIIHEK